MENTLDEQVIKNIFYVLLRIRRIEEAIANKYNEQEMRCPTHLSIGQEGVSALVGHFLKPTDLAVSSHRAHAHYLAKGGDLNALIAELYGRETGCTQGRGGSMNLSDRSVGFVASTAIVANTIPIGVGLAFAQKFKKTNHIVCVFLGDAAIEEGVFFESLNFAVLHKLPVIFVCENNFYSVNSHIDLRQPSNREIYQLARSIGAKSLKLNGNNVIDSFNSTAQAFEDLRNESGPWFIEYTTYRYKVHCGPQDDRDYKARPEKEINDWLKQDPLELLKINLLNESIITSDWIAEREYALKNEIERAFDFACQADYPFFNFDAAHVYSSTGAEFLQLALSVMSQEESANV